MPKSPEVATVIPTVGALQAPPRGFDLFRDDEQTEDRSTQGVQGKRLPQQTKGGR